MKDKTPKGFLIDFDLPAMKREQLRKIRIHFVISVISWIVFAVFHSFRTVSIVSLITGGISALVFITGLLIYCLSAKKCAVDDVTITVDDITIDEDIYSLKDPDLYFRIENGLRLDLFNLGGCCLVVENMKTQTKKRYWIGPKRHYDTMYKRELLMDEILLRQADNIEDKVPVTVRFPNVSMTVIGLGIPIFEIITGILITVMGCIWIVHHGLFPHDTGLYISIPAALGCVLRRNQGAPVMLVVFGPVIAGYGVADLFRNIANLTTMPRTVTVSDKGIDIDGVLFEYESYPDISWDRKSYGGDVPVFDFYLCIAGRRYWTGNSFMDGAEAASEEIRKAVLRLNPYERERMKNGRE